MSMDYKKDLAIDPDQLDEEWLGQSSTYGAYCELLDDAIEDRDRLKRKLAVERSKWFIEISKNPDSYELPKQSDTIINHAVSLRPEVIALEDELGRRNAEVGKLSSAVKSFEQRKRSLEKLVDLWIGRYYAGPKEPRNIPGGKRMAAISVSRKSTNSRQSVNNNRGASSESGGESTRTRTRKRR